MAQLTIQVPDELATRLQPILHLLPELLSQLLETYTPEKSTLTLSINIQKNPHLEIQTQKEILEDNTDFSAESFHKSWEQAITGKTLPLSQLWEDLDVD